MFKRLIVNADDYALTPAVSAGIRQAHLDGVVTSTTVMTNLPAAPAEVPRALADCPDLGLGVHLVLTAGRPLLPPEQLPTLLRLSDGRHFPKLMALVEGGATVDSAEVKAEWHAQIETFLRLTGRAPTHLDSHHHTAFLTPGLFGAMLELAREYGCAIRAPRTDPGVAETMLRLPPGSDLVQRLMRFIPPMLAGASDVPRPDFFEPRFFGEQATSATLRDLIAQLPEGVSELMCHPGLLDEQLSDVSSYYRYRAEELQVLTQPGLREHLTRLGIELIHFGMLRAAYSPGAQSSEWRAAKD